MHFMIQTTKDKSVSIVAADSISMFSKNIEQFVKKFL